MAGLFVSSVLNLTTLFLMMPPRNWTMGKRGFALIWAHMPSTSQMHFIL